MGQSEIRANRIRRSCIGTIPDDWEVVCISDIVERKPNAIVGGPFGSDLVSTDYVPSGVPVIRGANMLASIVSGDFAFISDSKGKSLSANMAYPGDIVFTQRGTLGQVAIVPESPFEKYLISQSQMKLSADGDIIHKPYLLHYFSSSAGQKQILDSSIQTGVPHTNLSILRNYVLPLPSLPEQVVIAEALSDADALIEGLERLIAKKRLIKQGAMQDLLTAKRRLPGFSGEWVAKPMGDIGPFVGGGTPSMAREDFWKEGTIPWVSSSDVRIGELCNADRMITLAAVKGSSTRVVEPNSILFVTRSGILRRFQPVMINTVPVAINQDIKALLPRVSEYSPRYIFHAAVAAGERILRDCMKTGTTVESIDLNALRRFEIGCPKDLDEQRSIAAVLNDMDAEIQALETRLDKARQVKEGMMQNLLTGRIRLV